MTTQNNIYFLVLILLLFLTRIVTAQTYKIEPLLMPLMHDLKEYTKEKNNQTKSNLKQQIKQNWSERIDLQFQHNIPMVGVIMQVQKNYLLLQALNIVEDFHYYEGSTADFATGYVSSENLTYLSTLDGIIAIEASLVVEPTLNDARALVNADDVWKGNLSNIDNTLINGQGVYVGIIERALPNYNHEAFQDENGNSRIELLWTAAGASSSNTDDTNHANHVTGISTGRGQDGNDIAGIAKGANILCAAVSSEKGIITAIEAFLDHAEGLPLVINISLGGNFGGDGKRQFNLYIDEIIERNSNLTIVFSAGNNGNNSKKPHYQSTFSNSQEILIELDYSFEEQDLPPNNLYTSFTTTTEVGLEIYNGDNFLHSETIYPSSDPATPNIVSIESENSIKVYNFSNYFVTDTFTSLDYSGFNVFFESSPERSFPKGNYKIKVIPINNNQSDTLHGFATDRKENKYFGFIDGDYNYTICSQALGEEVITVGAHNKGNNGDIADFSSKGPVIGDVEGTSSKPDITAPGVDIMSAVDDGYDIYDGTSMSAPVVTGIIALILQNFPELKHNEIKKLLKKSAQPIPNGHSYSLGNLELDEKELWGAGKVDALAAYQYLVGFAGDLDNRIEIFQTTYNNPYEGSTSSIMDVAGIPIEKVQSNFGGSSIYKKQKLTNGAIFYQSTTADNTSAYWIGEEIWQHWLTNGGVNSGFGLPTSSQYIDTSTGFPTVNFEHCALSFNDHELIIEETCLEYIVDLGHIYVTKKVELNIPIDIEIETLSSPNFFSNSSENIKIELLVPHNGGTVNYTIFDHVAFNGTNQIYNWTPENPDFVAQDVKIRVTSITDPNRTGESSNFNIEGYDNCNFAIPLETTDNCVDNRRLFYFQQATASDYANSCNVNTTNQDIWIQYLVPSSGHAVIEVLGEGSTSFAIYEGSCENLLEIACIDDTHIFDQTGLTPHTPVYIRVWYAGGGSDNPAATLCAYDGSVHLSQCANGIQDGDEIGVDCGGVNCPPCPDNTELQFPNGGENWTGGTTQSIIWTPNAAFERVRLLLSVDGGQNWLMPFDVNLRENSDYSLSVPNSGSFEWSIPCIDGDDKELFSNNCIIGIFEDNGSVTNRLLDKSDVSFSIAPCGEGGVDYILRNPSIEDDTRLEQGYYYDIIVEVGNTGNRPVPVSGRGQIGYFLSENQYWDASDIEISPDDLITTDGVNEFGQEYCHFILPDVPNGMYYLIFIADYLNEVEESNEQNNELVIPVQIGELALPDLSIQNITLSHSEVIPNMDIELTAIVGNYGQTHASFSNYSIFLSQNDQLDQYDRLYKSSVVDILTTNSTFTINTSFNIDDFFLSGSYYIIIQADSEYELVETNEDNNVFAIPVVISNKPELSISQSFISSNVIIPNQTIDYQLEVHNRGHTSVTSSNIGYYLSEDDVLDTSDILVHQFTSATIDAFTKNNYNGTFSIPENLTITPQYLLAKIDDTNLIDEFLENNNHYSTRIFSIPFQIELEIESASCGGQNGSVQANIIGGTPPFVYDWSFDSNGLATYEDMASGNYQLTVTDANGFVQERSFSIPNNGLENYSWYYDFDYTSKHFDLADYTSDEDGNLYLLFVTGDTNNAATDGSYGEQSGCNGSLCHYRFGGALFLAKFDKNGQLIFSKFYKDLTDGRLYVGQRHQTPNVKVAVDSSEKIYIFYQHFVRLNTTNNFNLNGVAMPDDFSNGDQVAAICNQEGEVIEIKTIDTAAGSTIIRAPNGKFYASYDVVEDDDYFDIGLSELDENFLNVNSRVFGGSKNQRRHHTFFVGDKIYINGYYDDRIYIDNYKSGKGMFLAQFDTQFNLQWIKYGENTSPYVIPNVKSDEEDNIYVLGVTNFDGFDLPEKTILKYDENGNFLDSLKTNDFYYLSQTFYNVKNDGSIVGRYLNGNHYEFEIYNNLFERVHRQDFRSVTPNNDYDQLARMFNFFPLENNDIMVLGLINNDGGYPLDSVYFSNIGIERHFGNGAPSVDRVYFSRLERTPLEVHSTQLPNDTTLCSGESILLDAGNPTLTHLWSTGATTQTITVDTAGTYSVSVTNAEGCTAQDEIVVNIADDLELTLMGSDEHCNKQNGAITTSVTGGTPPYTYDWSNNATTNHIRELQAGTYHLLLTDANGCTVTDTLSLINTNEPSTIQATVTNTSCGLPNGQIAVEVMGGAAPYLIQWSNGKIGITQDKLSAADYTLTVTDNNGCSLESPIITVGADSSPTTTVDFTPLTSCTTPNATATLNINNGQSPYSILWSDGQTTTTATNLSAGIYTVTAEDANGCLISEIVTIPAYNTPIIEYNATDATCSNGGNISLNHSGGYPPFTYQWSNGTSTQNNTNLAAGIHILTLTDANGCQSIEYVEVTGPAVLQLSASTTANECDDLGTATVVVKTGGTAPFSYQWNNGQTTATATSLNTGIYAVTVTDSQGCSSIQSVVVDGYANFTLDAVAVDDYCGDNFGKAFAFTTGGQAPFTYQWSNNVTTKAINNLAAATYTVTVTDANDCIQIGTATVQSTPLSLTLNPTATTCEQFNGQITISETGGVSPFNYNWSTGSTTSELTNIAAGNYTVTVTDAVGCVQTSAVLIENQGDLPTSDFTYSFSDDGYTLTLNDASLATNSISIDWGDGTISDGSTLAHSYESGTYNLCLIATNDCGSDLRCESLTIEQQCAAMINIQVTPTSCGSENGIVEFVINTGTITEINWDANFGSRVGTKIYGLAASSYQVSIADDAGCDYIYDVEIPDGNADVATERILTKTTGGNHDRYGQAVANSALFTMVTADRGISSEDYSGSVYVYANTSDGNLPVQRLQATDGAGFDAFGDAIAMDGDVAIIGAQTGTNQQSIGAAYIYRYNGNIWIEEAKLLAEDGEEGDYFGISVAIEGNTVIVGSRDDSDNTGAIYIFTFDGINWQQTHKFKDSTQRMNAFFGEAVAISDNKIVTLTSGSATSTEHKIHTFIKETNQWSLLSEQDLGEVIPFNAIALSDQNLFIGGYRGGNVGAVTHYTFNNNEWVDRQTIRASNGNAYDKFGSAMALDDGTLIVGSPDYDFNVNSNVGAVYVFYKINNAWQEERIITSSNGESSDRFGKTVAFYQNLLTVGGESMDDSNGSFTGTSYNYLIPNNTGDIDFDGICSNIDNCPQDFNPQQEDSNSDDIGNICEGNLPLEQLTFKANPQQNSINLIWHSTIEINLQHYHILRSTDGRNFNKIGQQIAQNEALVRYKFVDENVQPNQLYYYQLQTIDKAGTVSESVIRIAKIKSLEGITIYPNPTTGLVYLKGLKMKVMAQIRVYDSLGQLITKMTKNVDDNIINMNEFNNGVYFFDIQWMGQPSILEKVVLLK